MPEMASSCIRGAAAPECATLSGAGRKRRNSAIDGERDDAEHGDLTQGIETTEVDENDVDDVGATALRVGILDESNARRCRVAAVS